MSFNPSAPYGSNLMYNPKVPTYTDHQTYWSGPNGNYIPGYNMNVLSANDINQLAHNNASSIGLASARGNDIPQIGYAQPQPTRAPVQQVQRSPWQDYADRLGLTVEEFLGNARAKGVSPEEFFTSFFRQPSTPVQQAPQVQVQQPVAQQRRAPVYSNYLDMARNNKWDWLP